ncbi:MAG: ABC transporter permease [Actinobacteria bacterium]|nr:ABC transporter permease [Actinomycetota bacterium]
MLNFIVRRIVVGIVAIWVVSVLTFAGLNAAGGDVARKLLGESATPQQVKSKQVELGLNRPLVSRYWDWLSHAVRGDFGRSWFDGQPVSNTIQTRLPTTLSVVAVTVLVVAVVSVLIGVTAAVRRGWIDRALQLGSIGGASVPQFIAAVILVTIFAIHLRWLPATGYVPLGTSFSGWTKSITLPVIALALAAIASAAQQVRSAVIAELSRDYVRTLQGRGLARSEILFKHVLRGAAPAALTILSLQFIGLLGGIVVIEQIFALPGIGVLAVQSTSEGDTPVLMGIVVSTVTIVVVVNLIVDLAIGWLNPKARLA